MLPPVLALPHLAAAEAASPQKRLAHVTRPTWPTACRQSQLGPTFHTITPQETRLLQPVQALPPAAETSSLQPHWATRPTPANPSGPSHRLNVAAASSRELPDPADDSSLSALAPLPPVVDSPTIPSCSCCLCCRWWQQRLAAAASCNLAHLVPCLLDPFDLTQGSRWQQ